MSYIHCCCCSVAKSCPDICDPVDSSKPGFAILHYLLELPQIYAHWVRMLFNHLILCCSLLLLPSIFPSISVFFQSQLFTSGSQNTGASVSASDLPMNIQVLFPFDWFDLFAVQGTLKSILQHNSSKASTLWCSAFFIVQLSHLYTITRKTIAFSIWTFVSKVRCLPYTMQSTFVRAFLLRSFNFIPSAVILEPKKIKSVNVSIVSPSICHEVMGSDAMILVSFSRSDHELFVAKFRLKLKKAGKTTRPFRYDWNQLSYDYKVEVTD